MREAFALQKLLVLNNRALIFTDLDGDSAGLLSMLERPTNLHSSRARAYCACSR